MAKLLETLAFVLLIGGQFLSAIVLMSKRSVLYLESAKRRGD